MATNIKSGLAKAAYFRLPSYILLSIMTFVLLYDVILGKPFQIFVGYFLLTYVWCLFMNLLYNSGHESVSWILIFFPFVLLIAFILKDTTGTDYVTTIHDLSVFPIKEPTV
jgi:hypothetical protein